MCLADGDLLKIGNPARLNDFTSLGDLLVGARLGPEKRTQIISQPLSVNVNCIDAEQHRFLIVKVVKELTMTPSFLPAEPQLSGL